MKCDKKHMRLYAVTDSAWLGGRSLAQDVQSALEGGATMIQLREKELDFEGFLALALELKGLCNKYGVPLIINDNVDVAIAADCDGVHVGQSDLDALQVRERLGENKIIGVSAQTTCQAIAAVQSGADYLGVGAVFTTSTKSDADFVPYDELKAICAAVSVPVCAIGGIYENNIMELAGSGIDGVAVISAIFAQEDIKSATRRLLELSCDMALP